jgi:hypothetical protein
MSTWDKTQDGVPRFVNAVDGDSAIQGTDYHVGRGGLVELGMGGRTEELEGGNAIGGGLHDLDLLGELVGGCTDLFFERWQEKDQDG